MSGESLLNSPKTPQSYRTVKMPSFLAKELAEYLRLRDPANLEAHVLHHDKTPLAPQDDARRKGGQREADPHTRHQILLCLKTH